MSPAKRAARQRKYQKDRRQLGNDVSTARALAGAGAVDRLRIYSRLSVADARMERVEMFAAAIEAEGNFICRDRFGNRLVKTRDDVSFAMRGRQS